MKCPKCNIEAIITSSKIISMDGKVFREIKLSCRNKKCANNGKVIKKILTELSTSEYIEENVETEINLLSENNSIVEPVKEEQAVSEPTQEVEEPTEEIVAETGTTETQID